MTNYIEQHFIYLFSHLYIFFGEYPIILPITQKKKKMGYLFAVELSEFFMYSGY